MRQLTSGKSEVSFSGDWSPDGSKIAFVHYQFGDDHLQIRTMDADGKNPETVAECDPSCSATSRAGERTTARFRPRLRRGRGPASVRRWRAPR
jgi:Tol biopolymer transport system component